MWVVVVVVVVVVASGSSLSAYVLGLILRIDRIDPNAFNVLDMQSESLNACIALKS